MLSFTHTIGNGSVWLKFNDKPSAEIRGILKANGFRWSPPSGSWWRTRVTGAADFILALEKRIGPKRPDGACWECKSPEGYFRPYGAATPVYCDPCQAKHKAMEANESRALDTDRLYEDQCRSICGL